MSGTGVGGGRRLGRGWSVGVGMRDLHAAAAALLLRPYSSARLLRPPSLATAAARYAIATSATLVLSVLQARCGATPECTFTVPYERHGGAAVGKEVAHAAVR